MSLMSCRTSHHSFGVRLQRQEAELSLPHIPSFCAAACNQGKHSSTPPASPATGLLSPSPLTTAPPVRESRNCLHYKQDILPAPPRLRCAAYPKCLWSLSSNSSQWLKHRTVPSWPPNGGKHTAPCQVDCTNITQGASVPLVNTAQTCLACGSLHAPTRLFRCSNAAFRMEDRVGKAEQWKQGLLPALTSFGSCQEQVSLF